jgi:hypothetical protein
MSEVDELDRDDDEEPTDEELELEEPEGGEPWAKASSGDADEI